MLGMPHSKLLEDDSQLSFSQTADSSTPDHHHQILNDDKDLDGEMETAKGGYLGRFTTDRRGKF